MINSLFSNWLKPLQIHYEFNEMFSVFIMFSFMNKINLWLWWLRVDLCYSDMLRMPEWARAYLLCHLQSFEPVCNKILDGKFYTNTGLIHPYMLEPDTGSQEESVSLTSGCAGVESFLLSTSPNAANHQDWFLGFSVLKSQSVLICSLETSSLLDCWIKTEMLSPDIGCLFQS